MMVEPIVITAQLKTPLVLTGGYMTFDAILAAILFDQLQDVDSAHAAVPVKNTAGLFHASAAVIEPMDTGRVSFVANLRADHALSPDLIARGRTGARLHTALGRARRREFGAVMNNYQTITAASVTWYAEADAEAVRALLANVHFIGKRRASGFGEVAEWQIEPGDSDGITGPFGEPLRPVPAAMFKGDTSHPLIDAAWRPAYWHPAHRAACYAPPGLGG